MEEALVTEWLHWLENVRRLRSSTLYSYNETLRGFANWCGDSKDWGTVDAPTIEAFMGRLRRHGQVGAAASQDRDRIAIKEFYKWLQMRGYVTSNPTVDVGVPKVRNRQAKAVSDETWSRLWQSGLSLDDRVWLGLGCFAGLRRREIASLRPTSVDVHRGLLLHLVRKGGGEDAVEYEQMARIVADGLPNVLPDVDAWLKDVSTLVQMRRGERVLLTMDKPTTPLQRRHLGLDDPDLPSPAVLNGRLEVLLRAAGLSPRAFTPHALRHTCVTNLLRCGVPIEVVSDAVGHSNIDTTRRYVKSAGRLSDWRARLK